MIEISLPREALDALQEMLACDPEMGYSQAVELLLSDLND